MKKAEEKLSLFFLWKKWSRLYQTQNIAAN